VQQLPCDPRHPYVQQAFSLLLEAFIKYSEPTSNFRVHHEQRLPCDPYQMWAIHLCSLDIMPYFRGLLHALRRCKLVPQLPASGFPRAGSRVGRSERRNSAPTTAAGPAVALLPAGSSFPSGAIGVQIFLNLDGAASFVPGSPSPLSRTSTRAQDTSSAGKDSPDAPCATVGVLDAAWLLHQMVAIIDVLLVAFRTTPMEPGYRQECSRALSHLLSPPDALPDLIRVAMSPAMLAAAAQEQAAGRAKDTSRGPTASTVLASVQGVLEAFEATCGWCAATYPEEVAQWNGVRQKVVACLNSKEVLPHLEDVVLLSPLQGLFDALPIWPLPSSSALSVLYVHQTYLRNPQRLRSQRSIACTLTSNAYLGLCRTAPKSYSFRWS
jgi:hypothetical protein